MVAGINRGASTLQIATEAVSWLVVGGCVCREIGRQARWPRDRANCDRAWDDMTGQKQGSVVQTMLAAVEEFQRQSFDSRGKPIAGFSN